MAVLVNYNKGEQLHDTLVQAMSDDSIIFYVGFSFFKFHLLIRKGFVVAFVQWLFDQHNRVAFVLVLDTHLYCQKNHWPHNIA